MTLISAWFIIFVSVILIIYFLMPNVTLQKICILCANIIFYSSFGMKPLLLLIAMIGVSYVCMRCMYRNPGKYKLATSIGICLAPLLVLKYSGFVIDSIKSVLGLVHIRILSPVLSLAEPLGISFFTFKVISFLVDGYKGKIEKLPNILEYAMYISFFPTITSGPIDRPDFFLRQFGEKKCWNYDRFVEGFVITLFGFFEKMVIADRLSPIVNQVFSNYSQYSGFPLIVTSIFFTLQIYLDFSGYTFIVMGIIHAMGLEYTENFRQPYFSRSIQEFWHRWHMSLSGWLRDYVYIPLGGNRKGVARKYLNILITFLVSGIWHGAGFNFIVWGLAHGLFQVIGAITLPARTVVKKKLHIDGSFMEAMLQMLGTFILVDLAWVIFWSSRLQDGLRIIANMFPLKDVYISWLYQTGISRIEVAILAVAICFVMLIDYIRYKDMNVLKLFWRLWTPVRFLLLYALLFMIIILGYYGPGFDASSFIYFKF